MKNKRELIDELDRIVRRLQEIEEAATEEIDPPEPQRPHLRLIKGGGVLVMLGGLAGVAARHPIRSATVGATMAALWSISSPPIQVPEPEPPPYAIPAEPDLTTPMPTPTPTEQTPTDEQPTQPTDEPDEQVPSPTAEPRPAPEPSGSTAPAPSPTPTPSEEPTTEAPAADDDECVELIVLDVCTPLLGVLIK